jgi:EAL domain-containing protein (putative c-di-GMP-specific phosphodiesterase class I)
VHPQRGPIQTTEMVALAEASGLIAGIGAWVLEAGCSARGRWLRSRPDQPLDLAVNLSARQLMGPRLPATVAAILDRTNTEPAAVILEITEGVFLRDAARALSVLADLKALGVRLALDDFGTGYSSPNYLREFPVDILKIDQKFVERCASGAVESAIIAAITTLAHDIGLSVTAEGVETEEQRAAISEVGCDLAQGFLFSRALPAPTLDDLLAASRNGPLCLLPVAA